MTTHTHAPRVRHDLPPRWDGQPLQWRGWTPAPVVFVCPPPRDMGACRACSSLGPRSRNTGLIEGLVRLYVARCDDCRHDVVVDVDTDEVWDLDESDYGDAGSVSPDQVQEALF